MMRMQSSAATILIVWALTALVAAWAGPFGTYDSQPFIWRLGYWGFLIGVSVSIGGVAQRFWRRALDSKPCWVQDLLTVLTMTLVFGPMLIVVNFWMMGPLKHPDMDWRLSLAAIFLIGISTLGIERAMRAGTGLKGTEVSSKKRDRLLDRIPAAQDARLVKVSSDNHHVRITTDAGKEHRLLMRLSDAVTEIDVENGFYVHRSHWVAVHQIAHVGFVDNKEVIVLKSGHTVPIGPKYRHHLIGAGVIAA